MRSLEQPAHLVSTLTTYARTSSLLAPRAGGGTEPSSSEASSSVLPANVRVWESSPAVRGIGRRLVVQNRRRSISCPKALGAVGASRPPPRNSRRDPASSPHPQRKAQASSQLRPKTSVPRSGRGPGRDRVPGLPGPPFPRGPPCPPTTRSRLRGNSLTPRLPRTTWLWAVSLRESTVHRSQALGAGCAPLASARGGAFTRASPATA